MQNFVLTTGFAIIKPPFPAIKTLNTNLRTLLD